MKSLFGKLNKKDFKRSLGLAIGDSFTYLFGQMCFGMVPDGDMLKSVGSVFVGTMGVYLTKNLFTNSRDEFGEPEHEVKNNYI